jgi:hypothetical protein
MTLSITATLQHTVQHYAVCSTTLFTVMLNNIMQIVICILALLVYLNDTKYNAEILRTSLLKWLLFCWVRIHNTSFIVTYDWVQ